MTTLAPAAIRTDTVRHRIRVEGVVQGVGFRPFAHRLATSLALSGHVGNDTEGVFIEVEGALSQVERFEVLLREDAPPLAHVFHVGITPITPEGNTGFHITQSPVDGNVRTFVSPDIAVCDDCLAELFNPLDRRARYPFINCTNCGPRFTITVALPYDRPNTTMRDFTLCAACESEYHNPSDRRFHAQPIACADCGPRLWFDDGDGATVDTDAALVAAQRALARGEIVAIKGLGGYHLACNATSDAAVERLRQRKHRPHKPLAVMVNDLRTARLIAHVSPAEAQALSGRARPIVLLAQRQGSVVSPLVAPGNPHLGVLLPYTPLHHLLFAAVPGSNVPAPTVLVMTSGNLTDEPICFDDADAQSRLGAIADSWLTHDRPIQVPCDDSVVRMEGDDQYPIRRSRGYAPLPIRLPFAVGATLAMGGELKNTFCLASGRHAWISQHIGDMGSVETLAAFERSTRQFADMYRIEPEQIAADAHPGYHTRVWAEERTELPVILVQHHHAHVAAVMAEHGVPRDEKVIGFPFDGTGYGTDGAIWGGEVLITGYDNFERAAHLRYVPLPGGDSTIRKPYRSALSHLWSAGMAWTDDLPPVAHCRNEERVVLRQQLEGDVLCVPTSSMGRLFDAVSSLLGLRHEASYEAQAAIELEWIAAPSLDASRGVGAARLYAFEVVGGVIDPAPVLRSLAADLRRGVDVGAMAAGFHLALARCMADVAVGLSVETGITRVALCGGVFQNMLLHRLAVAALEDRSLEVLTPRVVPANDGGLALGQAVVAGARGLPGPSIRSGAGA